MFKQTIICVLAAIVPAVANAAAEQSASELDSIIRFDDFNYIHNVEDGSLNPTSLNYVLTPRLAIVKAGYDWGRGSLHSPSGTGHQDQLNVETYGIRRLSRTVFEGTISYHNQNLRSACWNSTLFQSKLNPFVLADSLSSDYNIERFHVAGRAAYTASSKITLGINADYNVGVLSDEQDPRLETKGMRFILNPGIEWKISPAVAVGATGGINLFSESYHYSCLATAVNYHFFIMSGLGTFYPQSGSSYNRDSKGTSWFAGGNVRFNIQPGVSDYLSVTYSHQFEKATDGGTIYQFKAGEFTDNNVKVSNRVSIKNDATAHNITLTYEGHKVDGRWFEQKPVVENGTTHYEVMSSSIKHKQVQLSGRAAYRFDMLNSRGVTTLKADAAIEYLHSNERNYPERYFQKYNLFTASAGVTKYLRFKKVHMGIGVDGKYTTCTSSDYNFTGLELADQYSLPMNAYLTSDVYDVNGHLTAHLPIRDLVLGLTLKGGHRQCVGGYLSTYKHRRFTTLSCALSLSF